MVGVSAECCTEDKTPGKQLIKLCIYGELGGFFGFSVLVWFGIFFSFFAQVLTKESEFFEA